MNNDLEKDAMLSRKHGHRRQLNAGRDASFEILSCIKYDFICKQISF